MTHLKQILVPVDFSDNSAIAVRHAGVLARRFHSEITLLHVNEISVIHPLSGPLGFGITSAETERSEYLARRREQLETFGVAELGGISVKRLVCCGDPARVIVECAHNNNADLILMPTRGYGGFRRFLLGSVTAKILHDAEAPVWTGAHLADASRADPAEIHDVMCAVNFGPQSVRAIHWAADFAAGYGGKLTVVHAVLDTPPNLPERYMFQWHEEAHFGADERLRALLLDSGIQADALVVGNGDVPKAIAAAAHDKGAGLLVIGRNCAGETTQRLGTQTYSLICQAPCPVVSV